jgi:hypothetical protein
MIGEKDEKIHNLVLENSFPVWDHVDGCFSLALNDPVGTSD